VHAISAFIKHERKSEITMFHSIFTYHTVVIVLVSSR